LTIQATSDFGTLAGLTLDVAVHRGSISEKQVILDDQGHATVIYDAGHYPGFAQLSAKVAGTSKIHTQEFFVKNVGDYLERNVLVTNGTGTIDVDGVSHAYSGTTNLVIQAAPGEVIEPSLADIFEPPVYALQDYALGNQVGSDVKLLDMSSGIDAEGRNLQMVAGPERVGLAWALTSDSEIIVPEHSRTANLNQAGVNFWVKFPTLQGAATLVDWDDFGLSLKITADHRLLLEGNSGGASYSVISSNALQAGHWHRVSAHFRNGSLYLGLDGEVASTGVSGALTAPKSKGHALQIRPNDEMHLAGLKIYDWEGEAKITFGGGSFDTNVTADATGKAVVPLRAQAAVLAYTRLYHQPERSLIAHIGQILIPTAHATDAATQACVNSFAPPPLTRLT